MLSSHNLGTNLKIEYITEDVLAILHMNPENLIWEIIMEL